MNPNVNVNQVFNRAISIVKTPVAELNKVKTEQISINDLIRQYTAVLAIIPAIGYFIGYGIVGVSYGFFTIPVNIVTAFIGAIVTFLLSIAMVYIAAIVINSFAPNFASKPGEVQAMKLSAYAATPGQLGGIFYIIPSLGILAFIAMLYGFYILYLGIPVLMETPKEKQLPYAVVIIVVEIVIAIVIGAITGSVMRI